VQLGLVFDDACPYALLSINIASRLVRAIGKYRAPLLSKDCGTVGNGSGYAHALTVSEIGRESNSSLPGVVEMERREIVSPVFLLAMTRKQNFRYAKRGH
jgi:hypothetical protein